MPGKENSNPFEGLSFEEITHLPNEEFIKKMELAKHNYFSGLEDLGDPAYKGYSPEQKIAFWETSLNKQMRRQVESGFDEYAIFSVDWYQAIKRLEPGIDSIMAQVFDSPGFSGWEKEEYLKRIHGA